MANAPVVSVIIPMYNVEKYIAETLESLLMQTLQDFEVIIINDCSPDKSREIAETYLEKFGGRMKIFDNKENSGPSASRNNGLIFSRGEYVFLWTATICFWHTLWKKCTGLPKNMTPILLTSRQITS